MSLYRYTIQLPEFYEQLLNELSPKGSSKAETIRRAVSLYAFIKRELAKGDRTLKIYDEDTGQEIVFPTHVIYPGLARAIPKKPKKKAQDAAEIGY